MKRPRRAGAGSATRRRRTRAGAGGRIGAGRKEFGRLQCRSSRQPQAGVRRDRPRKAGFAVQRTGFPFRRAGTGVRATALEQCRLSALRPRPVHGPSPPPHRTTPRPPIPSSFWSPVSWVWLVVGFRRPASAGILRWGWAEPSTLPFFCLLCTSRLLGRSLWVAFTGEGRLKPAAAPKPRGVRLHVHDESDAVKERFLTPFSHRR